MKYHSLLALACALSAAALPQAQEGSKLVKRDGYVSQIFRGLNCDGDLLQYFSDGGGDSGCINVGAVAGSAFIDVQAGNFEYIGYAVPDCGGDGDTKIANAGTDTCIIQGGSFQSVRIVEYGDCADCDP